ncbi:hypothetical protein PG994_012424 [Apiospora phragmitis]|uniref:CFEM domain-containing protein n=1 Tax=Apiospora phragmitis TaxID=2905665 RepID=A0ABR1TVM2_9PEZI
MHFNAAFIALLAAAAGVGASTIEDRNLNGPPLCAELCFKKAVEASQCKNQKHYIRNLWKKYPWECLCKDQKFHDAVVPCIEKKCNQPKERLQISAFIEKTCGYSIQVDGQAKSPQSPEQPPKSQYRARNYNNPKPKQQAPKNEYKPIKKPESHQAPKDDYKPKKTEQKEPAKNEYKPTKKPEQQQAPKDAYKPKKTEQKEPAKDEHKPAKKPEQQQAPKGEYKPKKPEHAEAPKGGYKTAKMPGQNQLPEDGYKSKNSQPLQQAPKNY